MGMPAWSNIVMLNCVHCAERYSLFIVSWIRRVSDLWILAGIVTFSMPLWKLKGKFVVSLTVTSITLTAAVMDHMPKLFCGALGSGVGSLKLAEAMPVWFVIPCLTAMTEPFEFCIEKITLSS